VSGAGDGQSLLPIGTIVRPHGVRGAVKANCAAGFDDYLRSLPEVRVGKREFRISEVLGMPGQPILKLEGVDSREGAEALRGLPLAARREELPALEEDEFYHADLEGCAAWADGARVGVVRDVRSLPANSVLTIELAAGGELLVPFTREAVPHVDLDGRRIELDAAFLGLDD
jgi:16S rRNA processing protein RimM